MDGIRVLVTGSTGYIGGRLVRRLLDRGYAVRCLVRDRDRLRGRRWENLVDVTVGDALEYDTLAAALERIDIAYYLIHSLASGQDFARRDRMAAENFGRAAASCDVKRIIYLGGIRPKGARQSKHLESRIETGQYLSQAGVPVTEFRAAVVVGSGSLSFELIRYLTERVPVMVCPRWVKTRTQPIAIRTVLEYLLAAPEKPESTGRVIEIGGREILTYEEMFRSYAKVRGLKRLIINVPVLSPRLSSLWVGLVTPISTTIARPLIEGLDNEVVVTDDAARTLFDVEPLTYEMAVRRALRRFDQDQVETSWHGAYSSSVPKNGELEKLMVTEGMIQEVRQRDLDVEDRDAFSVIRSLGGEKGWLYANGLWKLRGLLDQLVGGVGLRRGRRSPTEVRVGDAIDFWRVEEVQTDRLLRLRAEMKVPGEAWLQFEVLPLETTGVRVVQSAYFEPKGLWGLMYWYALYPVHKVIFRGMMRELARQSLNAAAVRHAARPAQPGA